MCQCNKGGITLTGFVVYRYASKNIIMIPLGSTQDIFATLTAVSAIVKCCNISFVCDGVGPA